MVTSKGYKCYTEAAEIDLYISEIERGVESKRLPVRKSAAQQLLNSGRPSTRFDARSCDSQLSSHLNT
jgi:hypothetical protein